MNSFWPPHKTMQSQRYIVVAAGRWSAKLKLTASRLQAARAAAQPGWMESWLRSPSAADGAMLMLESCRTPR